MPAFEQTEQEFAQYERGEARLNAIRSAIREADQVKDFVWQFWFRYDYIEESIFCGDRYFALITFPELLQLYDDTPKLREDKNFSHSMMVCFRWIVEAVEEFPQISKEQIDSYFRAYKRRLRELGYSLNIYYMKRSLVYIHMNLDKAAADFYRFLEEPIDAISDGRPLCQNHRVEMYLAMDEEEKALRAAEPIFAGKYKSSALPHSTYHKLCRYYLGKGDYEKAEEYGKNIIRKADGDLYHMHYAGTLMSLYSVRDPQKGLELFNRNYPLYLTSKNPWLRCCFIMGASHLLARLAKDGVAAEKLRLPAGSPPEGLEMREIAAKIYAEAEDYANKFDTRNGTKDYWDMLHNLPVMS